MLVRFDQVQLSLVRIFIKILRYKHCDALVCFSDLKHWREQRSKHICNECSNIYHRSACWHVTSPRKQQPLEGPLPSAPWLQIQRQRTIGLHYCHRLQSSTYPHPPFRPLLRPAGTHQTRTTQQ